MNPRAGDTVTSTKPPTTNTTTTTSTTTTGARRFGHVALRPETATSAKAHRAPRKRRQQVEPELPQQQSVTRPRPEVNTPPPEKSRRRAATAEQAAGERAASKSRLGDFFSSLASRIRSPKNADTMQGNHENLESQEFCRNDVTQAAAKREGNEEIVQSTRVDFKKRRKLGIDRRAQKCESDANCEAEVTLRDAKSENTNAHECGCSEHLGENCDASTSDSKNEGEIPSKLVLKCDSYVVLNKILDQETDATDGEYAHETTVDVGMENRIADECNTDLLLSERKTDDEGESKIIDMCRSIVASMCEKIQDTEEAEQSKNSSEPMITNEFEALDLPADDRNLQPNDRNLHPTLSTASMTSQESIPIELEVDSAEAQKNTSAQRRVEKEKDPPIESESRISLRPSNPRPSSRSPRWDDTVRLRKTIQWLEEGSRRLREDLASVRSELHEERRAAKLARRELDTAIREARSIEAAKYAGVISELKARLSQSPSRSAMDSLPSLSKTDLLKDENHRREMAALKKRLAEAESTIQKLKTNSLDRGRAKKKNKEDESGKLANAEVRKLEVEVQSLRATNKKLEEKLHIAEESARARAAELRVQHESHEAELSALQKALRSDTIKMIDEIQSKNREIEKLEKLVNECAQMNQKLRTKEDETMRKLRESERSHQIRLASRIEEKIHHDDHMGDLCKVDCDEDAAATKFDRLRELAVEQQEVIEVLRQAVKEKERKLEQLSNKRRKEEFYKQWLELEPVAEVDDEDEHQQEEGDSALSSAPSSLSPQPNASRNNGVTREAYENVLIEIEELQTKLLEEQQELCHARSQVRDLEKALLQETRGSQNNRRALSEKLRVAEEREASLIAEISELREQNELLEFRVLELEESPNPRDTPDPADSGIVSPEPIHLYKDHQSSKHRDRAVATVIPYTSSYSHPVLPIDPQKAPLSLQESGIFEEEDVEEEEIEDHVDDESKIELASQSTQTEAPAGELLQEVQRLQELRARIQERAAKVPPVSPISDRKNEAPCDFALDVTPLRERIRELEERLNAHESERRVSKQREEELLDENYRLTEKTFWLEAELKKLQEKLNEVKLSSDAETMTDQVVRRQLAVQTDVYEQCQVVDNENKTVMDDVDNSSEMSRCQRLYTAAISNQDESGSAQSLTKASLDSDSTSKRQPCLDCSELWKDCDARIHNLASLRQQIASLEHRESAFFETLRQADATWAKLEADYEAKQKEMNERLTAQVELNRALFEHLTKLNKMAEKTLKDRPEEPMEVDDDVTASCKSDLTRATQTDELESCRCQTTPSLSRSSSSATTGLIVRADSSRVSTISRTSITMAPAGCDDIDTSTILLAAADPPAEIATEAKEEDNAQPCASGQIPNPATSADAPQRADHQKTEGQQQPEALVSIDESSSDKKVSKPSKGAGMVRQGMSSVRSKAISFERNLVVSSARSRRRLTLYQEICV
ncbi:janus kinase and microtubule-interacting protein 3 isoform X3 [Nasonia vitripennis]|uniref:Janus kinase and microtubule-interacting protein C-terminal domain-containing protein n=1 Tax=Nasonia vitripennis TaxID=7425 RepID=A0A7M7R1U9_NASVI|nr:janus kinase and microtubule-interacting protein 3 isoform X3 [Nasonia vitripennis]